VLRIRRDLVDAMVEHARRDHPDEACGILAGPEGEDRPERAIAMLNAARSPTYYEFDPTEWNAVYNEMTAKDEEPVVIYHSHTATEAYPSRTDIARAGEYAMLLPSPHYVLISTRDADTHELRSYRIDEGEVTEEPVEVTEYR
jgi:proteasome lid subunit RPN8/RPN11